MIIYVVTSGEYSDYGIRAVFTDKNAAEKYVEQLNTPLHEGEYMSEYDVARIEEWTADEKVGMIRRMVYLCNSDGREWSYSTESQPNARTPTPHIDTDVRGDFRAHSFVSAEHARKLMFEEKQRRLREKNL